MAQVDFYQLSRDPPQRVVALLAAKVLEAGERLLVVSADAAQRAALSEALWAREGFLAHGAADDAHAERQPILLAEDCAALNGASHAIMADGRWREEAAGFERLFLLFAPEQTEPARELWSRLSAAGHSLRIFKQGEGGGWQAGR